MDVWMTMMEKFGWPAIVVALLVFFWYKKVWPFLIEQLTYHQKKLDESQGSFMLALERRDMALARQGELLSQLAGEISEFRQFMRAAGKI